MPIGHAQFPLHKSGFRSIRGLELLATLSACLLLGSCAGAEPEDEDGQSSLDRALEAQNQVQSLPHKALCDNDTRPGMRHCHARVRTDSGGIVPFAAGPSGLSPADLRAAYSIPLSGGSGKTIAIVDAQDDPNAEADLAKYRSQFGLSPCTTANGCFRKANGN